MLSLSVGAKPRKGWACGLPLIAAAEPLHMSRTAFACQRDVTSTPEARANRFTFFLLQIGTGRFGILCTAWSEAADLRLSIEGNE